MVEYNILKEASLAYYAFTTNVEIDSCSWQGVLETPLCDKVCQWFSPATSVSSTIKTDRHDLTEKLLKVALNTITLTLTICEAICLTNHLCIIHVFSGGLLGDKKLDLGKGRDAFCLDRFNCIYKISICTCGLVWRKYHNLNPNNM
jgi:hypothetical protein